MKSNTKPTPAQAGEVIDADFDDMPGGGAMVVHDQAVIRTQFVTAMIVPKPRKMLEVAKKVEDEAELAGRDVFYQWTQGGQIIEGLSIDGAMILARNYGNCHVEAQVVKESPTHWLFDACFIDLETGMTTRRQYRQRKGESHQKSNAKDADRLLDIAFQIGQSKAIRNVIDKAIPIYLKNRCLAKGKEAEEKGYEKIDEEIKKELEWFGKIKPRAVTQEILEKKLDKPLDAWTANDVRTISGIRRGLQSRETSVRNEFWPEELAPTSGETKPAGAATKPAAGETKPKPDETKTPPPETKATPAAKSAPADASGTLFPTEAKPKTAEATPKPAEREPGEDG